VLNPEEFSALLLTIENTSLEKNRLDLAHLTTNQNCLTTSQIISIMNTFSFEASKLEFAKNAYDNCLDQNNYFMLMNHFSFSSSVTDLTNLYSNKVNFYNTIEIRINNLIE